VKKSSRLQNVTGSRDLPEFSRKVAKQIMHAKAVFSEGLSHLHPSLLPLFLRSLNIKTALQLLSRRA
jgi:hypothetical protein